MRLWVRPEVTWHKQSVQFLSTIAIAPDTDSLYNYESVHHDSLNLIYGQIKNESAFPAEQLFLYARYFHSVSIQPFDQLNNALNASEPWAVNKEERSLSGYRAGGLDVSFVTD